MQQKRHIGSIPSPTPGIISLADGTAKPKVEGIALQKMGNLVGNAVVD